MLFWKASGGSFFFFHFHFNRFHSPLKILTSEKKPLKSVFLPNLWWIHTGSSEENSSFRFYMVLFNSFFFSFSKTKTKTKTKSPCTRLPANKSEDFSSGNQVSVMWAKKIMLLAVATRNTCCQTRMMTLPRKSSKMSLKNWYFEINGN